MIKKVATKISEMLEALADRIFWTPTHNIEMDLVLTAYRELDSGKNVI